MSGAGAAAAAAAAAATAPRRVAVIDDKVHEMLGSILRRRGWTSTTGEAPANHHCSLHWKHSRFTASQYSSCDAAQLLNHFPKTSALTKKDMLARNLRRMKNVYGRIYNFFPDTFILPREKEVFLREHAATNSPQDPNIWIVKPAGSSRGRGIFLVCDATIHLIDSSACIVQHYIRNPLLLSGYKFDLRIYAVVLSFRPLVVYIYNRGLARFGTEPYSSGLDTLENLYSHLTNASVNKFSPSFQDCKEGVGTGSKLTLEAAMKKISDQGLNTSQIWRKIKQIVVLTFLSAAHQIPVHRNCFELFGFDFMLDCSGTPWLLEVNSSPALAVTCAEDQSVKVPLIHDLMDLLGFAEGETRRPSFAASDDASWTRPADRQGDFELIFPCEETSFRASEQYCSTLGQAHIAAAEQRYQKMCVATMRRLAGHQRSRGSGSSGSAM